MAQKLYGDVPQEHIDLAEELTEMEEFFDNNLHKFHKADVAKVYVCLARDWYDIGLDSNGSELLLKANKICPGYFSNEIITDIDEDSDFEAVVNSLTYNILLVAKSLIGSDD